METTNRKLEDNKVEITVTLAVEEVQKEIDAAYKEAGKNRIPGFRPGKAPRKILENHFGGKEYFQATATDELVRSFAPLAPDELNLIPLNSPDFSEFDLAEEGKPFSFTLTIEVTPELKLSSYDPVQIELPSAEPTEEEIQTQIDALLAYYVTTDEEGNEQKPELTDVWVKETLEFEGVDELKERVAESLREQKGQDIPMLREILSSQELAGRLVGEVPDVIVRQTEQDNYKDLFQSLQQQRLTLDAYMESRGYTAETFRESMRQQAEASAAISLALDALAREIGLTATDDEIMEEFEKSGAKEPEKLFEDWRRNGRLSEIRRGILRMKASRHIYDTAEIFEPGTLHPVEEEEEESAKAKPAEEKEQAASGAADAVGKEEADGAKDSEATAPAGADTAAGAEEGGATEKKPVKKPAKATTAKKPSEATEAKGKKKPAKKDAAATAKTEKTANARGKEKPAKEDAAATDKESAEKTDASAEEKSTQKEKAGE